jgi:hypothetical protein
LVRKQLRKLLILEKGKLVFLRGYKVTNEIKKTNTFDKETSCGTSYWKTGR